MATPLPTRKEFVAGSLKPATAKDIDKQTDKMVCIICYEALKSPVTTPCDHVFCEEDVLLWLEQSPQCPKCKRVLYQPETAKLRPAIDAEPLELDFTLDEAAVVRGLNAFDAAVEAARPEPLGSDPDFSWPAESMVYIDLGPLLPLATDAALWIKSDTDGGNGGRSLADVCRSEWQWAVNEIKCFLEAREGDSMDAAQFNFKLAAAVNRYITWKAFADELPTYGIAYATPRTLAADLDVMYDYITCRGVQDHVKLFS
ncbi:hypothetical protein LTR36_009628 [Oleoguttula mirabilis]|uniref:RING-type domain-containing protein n=1 Tax=Oleoguttula mirabilis TaxID=1507867 RepID=A0AAV9J630_9PEZI|nr:hypothetical protein LTR36_009628 [Oleoguttula mirabilis]